MKLSLREMVMAWLTGIVVLFGLTWWWYWQPQMITWKTAGTAITAARQRIQIAEHLLSRQDEWDARLEDVKKALPAYKGNQEVTSDFLKLLERLASKNGLVLLKARPTPEEPAGDLYQMTIHYSWEGDLDALVRFLYGLQAEQANLHVRQLNVSPSSKNPQELSGKLSIDFAYTRENR